MARSLNPPFGTYALPDSRERLRLKAEASKDSRMGKAIISHLRGRALKGLNEPFDITVAPDVKARLYPSQNRCEKRAFAGVQVWDNAERSALKQAVENCGSETFSFVDVGANVGLYSLFVASYCKAAQISSDIIAIEPGVKMAERLSDNIAASDARIQVIRAAVSDKPGTGRLGGGEINRGEAHLMDTSIDLGNAATGEIVVIDTLARIALSHGLTKIDAMKLDIEGHDEKALTAFFIEAPRPLFPKLLILETGKEPTSPLIDLCHTEGYELVSRHGLNTIMTLKETEPHVLV